MGGALSSSNGSSGLPSSSQRAPDTDAVHLSSSPSPLSQPQNQQASRKRRLPPCSTELIDIREENARGTEVDQKATEQFADHKSSSQIDAKKVSSIDATPDGETYRYKVQAGELYWAMRKDITKFIAKLPEPLPAHSGLQKMVKKDHFFICFPNAKCAEKGVNLLTGRVFRKQALEVERVARQPFKRQRVSTLVKKAPINDETNVLRDNDNDGDKDGEGNGEAGQDRQKSDLSPMAYPSGADVTAQWRDVPYDKQVQRKRAKIISVLRDVTRHLRRELKHIDRLPWLSALVFSRPEQDKRQPLCCPLVAVLAADDQIGVRDYYRNKNEFTIGRPPCADDVNEESAGSNAQTSEDAVIGFTLGLMRRGQFCVGAVDESCKTTSKLAIEVARALTPVVRASGLPPYDRFSHVGYWRQLTIRESSCSGQALVTVAVNPKYFETERTAESDSCLADSQCREAVVSALKALFRTRHEHAVREDDDAVGITWQPCADISSVPPDTPTQHLYGLKAIHETLQPIDSSLIPQPKANNTASSALSSSTVATKDGEAGAVDTATPSNDVPISAIPTTALSSSQGSKLKFRIQPGSFFQVNSRMADVLYGLVADCASLTEETTILDVCCGTGTIGISLARRVRDVLGIEISKVAVIDAEHNAKLNSVDNARFIVGKVEEKIHEAVRLVVSQNRGKQRPCVVVLDPPRAGVPNSVIAAIRGMPQVTRVVYVACEPKNFFRNALGFCRPTSKAFRLEPFQPVFAYGVDLFPHTPHVEMVVVLDRILDYEPVPKFVRKEGDEAQQEAGDKVTKDDDGAQKMDCSNETKETVSVDSGVPKLATDASEEQDVEQGKKDGLS